MNDDGWDDKSWWDEIPPDDRALVLILGGLAAMVCFICFLAVL